MVGRRYGDEKCKWLLLGLAVGSRIVLCLVVWLAGVLAVCRWMDAR